MTSVCSSNLVCYFSTNYSVIDLCLCMLVNKMNDGILTMTFDDGHDHKLMIWRIQEKSFLMVTADKNVRTEVYQNHVEEALEIIEQGIPDNCYVFLCILSKEILTEKWFAVCIQYNSL